MNTSTVDRMSFTHSDARPIIHRILPLRRNNSFSIVVFLAIAIIVALETQLRFPEFLQEDINARRINDMPALVPSDGSIESLIKLTRSHETKEMHCAPSLELVNDTLLADPALAYAGGRKIPRIVHISSASRCNDKIIADNLDTWRLDDHYFFLHDNTAVLKLLREYDWIHDFPMLTHVMKCMPKGMGAAWIDLWRLLVLWEYGGIYADLDTSPVPALFNATTISPEDDAFFVQEGFGTPSQWFMAASPKHPVIFLSIFHLMMNVLQEQNLGNFQVVFTTGPGAVAGGFASFLRRDVYSTFTKAATAGHYVGVANRSITIVGNSTNENMYITRVIQPLLYDNVKHDIYKKTNMTHLRQAEGTIYKPNPGVDESCMGRLYGMRERLTSMVKSL